MQNRHALEVRTIDTPGAAMEALKQFEERYGVDNPFLSKEWFQIWWEAYDKRDNLRILLFSHGTEVIGLAPLYCEERPFGIHEYRFLGHGKSNYLEVRCRPGFERQVVEAMLDFLYFREEPAILDLNDVRDDSLFFDSLRQVLTAGRMDWRNYPLYPCAFGHLNDRWEKIFDTSIAKSKYRSEFKRKIARSERFLSAIGKLESVIVEDRETWARLFPRLEEIHSLRFAGTVNNVLQGRNREFIYRVTGELLGRGMVVSLLTLDGEPISFVVGLFVKDAFVHYVPAFDPAFQKCSLGHLHLKYLADWLVRKGIPILDLSKGENSYKGKWSDGAFWNHRFLAHLNATTASRIYFFLKRRRLEATLWGRKSGYNKQVKKWIAGSRSLFGFNKARKEKAAGTHSRWNGEKEFQQKDFTYESLSRLRRSCRGASLDYYFSHPKDDLRLHVNGARIVLENRTKNEYRVL